MKKISVLAAALAIGAVSFVSAEGFKLNGYIRAGWANTIDAIDTDNDGDGDTASASTETWLAGDYFGGSTRSRLNLGWSNKNESAGAFVRLQYTGAAEDFDLTDVTAYAYGWVNPFEGKLTVAAGKIKDDWIGSDGYEGFSVLDGKSGFFAGVNPIEGLTVGGGAVVDYLLPSSSKTVYTWTQTEDKPEGEWVASTKTSGHRASKRAAYFGAKYSTDAFTADAGYALAGEFYANLNVTAVENLLLAFEAKHDTDDILDEETSYDTAENTFVEQIEYTGIDKLLIGVVSYQWINNHKIADDSNTTITINPYARYEINDVVAASVEGTVHLYDYDKAPDTYTTIVPAVYFKVVDGAEANVFAKISTDTDQEKHQVGAGVIFKF